MKNNGRAAALVIAVAALCAIVLVIRHSALRSGPSRTSTAVPGVAVTSSSNPTNAPVVYVPSTPTPTPRLPKMNAPTETPQALQPSNTPAPVAMTAPLVTMAPSALFPPVLRQAPDAPPRIIALSLNASVAQAGQIVAGTVETSSNVASVEARIGGYGASMQKVGAGRFHLTYKVPYLPFFLHRTYMVQIIARNTRGQAVSTAVPLTIR